MKRIDEQATVGDVESWAMLILAAVFHDIWWLSLSAAAVAVLVRTKMSR